MGGKGKSKLKRKSRPLQSIFKQKRGGRGVREMGERVMPRDQRFSLTTQYRRPIIGDPAGA